MYYEDKGYRLELVSRLQAKVSSFFSKEFRNDASKEQLTAISTYNLTNLAYHRFDKYYYFEDFMVESNKAIKLLFTPVNEHDLTATRLEQLSITMITLFGKELVDELKQDLIEYILSVNPGKRFDTKYNAVDITPITKTRAELKEIERCNKDYEQYIKDLFVMYPALWLVPFLSEAFIADMS